MGVELIIELGVILSTSILAVGGFIWMLKNHEKRITRTEDQLVETGRRIDSHDIIFSALKVDLDYMRQGIDSLKAGQERLEHQHYERMEKEFGNEN